MNRNQAARSFTANFRARFVKPTLASAAFLAAALLGGNAQAQTWVGNTDTTWSNGANWSPATEPGNASTPTFGTAGSAGTSLLDDFGGNPYYFSGMTFNSGASSFTINPSSGTPYYEMISSGITDNSVNTETVNLKLTMYNAGSGNFNVAATGMLVLGGGLSVSTTDAGTQTTASIDGSSNVGGTVDFSGGTVTLTGLTVGNGSSGNGSNWATSSTALFNGATFNDSGTVTLGGSQLVIASGTTATVTGNITTNQDWASLLMTGGSLSAANVTLTGDGNGGQVVLDGGTLTTGSISAIDWEYPSGGQMSLLVFNGTQINSSTNNSTFVSVTPGGIAAFAGTGGNIAYIGTGGLLLNTEGNNDTITSQLKDLTTTQTTNDDVLTSGMAGSGALTKSGAGTLTLSNGANSFSGGVNVTGGTLATTAAGALGSTTNTLSLSGGGILDLETTTQTVGATSLGASTIQSTGGAGTLNTGVVTVTGAGAISSGATVATGANAVNINSGGALTLNGASSLSTTGTVTVNSGGSLVFGASSAISSGATIQGAGGTITMAGTTQSVNSLTLMAASGTTELDLGLAGNSSLTTSGGSLTGGILDINDWSGNTTGAMLGGTNGYFVDIAALSVADLDDIEWTNATVNGSPYSGMGAQYLNGQLTPDLAPIPEPSTVFGALCLLGLVGWRNRRQIGEALQGVRLNGAV